jgi:hypothetical protein
MDAEDKAKISAAELNGYALDKKHTISVCTFNDFDKIMEMGGNDTTSGEDPL